MPRSTSSPANKSAVAHNDRLWPQFREAFLNRTDPTAFVTVGQKFKTWLSSPKAYYPAARPHIVDLIEIAQRTVMHGIGFPEQNHAAFRAYEYKDNEMCKTYISLVGIVRPYANAFEPHLRARLETQIKSATEALPTPPISPADDRVDSRKPSPKKSQITQPAPSLQVSAPVGSLVKQIASPPFHLSVPRPHMPPLIINRSSAQASTSAAPSPATPAFPTDSPITPMSASAPVKRKRKKGAGPKLDAIFAEDIAWYTSKHKEQSVEFKEPVLDVKVSTGTEILSKTEGSTGSNPTPRSTKDPSVDIQPSAQSVQLNNAVPPPGASTEEFIASEPGTKAPIPAPPIQSAGNALFSEQSAAVIDVLHDHKGEVGQIAEKVHPNSADEVDMLVDTPTQPSASAAPPTQQIDADEKMTVDLPSRPQQADPVINVIHADKLVTGQIGDTNGGVHASQEILSMNGGAEINATLNGMKAEDGGSDIDEEVQVETQLYEEPIEPVAPEGPQRVPTSQSLPTLDNRRTSFILTSATWPQLNSRILADNDGSDMDIEDSPIEERPAKRPRTSSAPMCKTPSHPVAIQDETSAVDEFGPEVADVQAGGSYPIPLVRVVAITKCANASFRFEVTPELFTSLSVWRNRDARNGYLAECLCLSLSCCTTDEFKAKQGPPEERAQLASIISSCEVQWPSSGELSVEITNKKQFSESKRIHLAPPFMLDSRPDHTVDITNFVTVGENTVQFKLIEHLSKHDYLVYLLLHQPTPSQRAEFAEQHRKFKEWRGWVQDMCRPLQVSSQPFLSPSIF